MNYMQTSIKEVVQKIVVVSLQYVKFISEQILNICGPFNIMTIFKSNCPPPRKNICLVKDKLKENLTKSCVHSMPCSCSTHKKIQAAV